MYVRFNPARVVAYWLFLVLAAFFSFVSCSSAFADTLTYVQTPDGQWRVQMSARQIADLQRTQGGVSTVAPSGSGVRVAARGVVPVGVTTAEVTIARDFAARNVGRAVWRGAAAVTGPYGAIVITAGAAAWCKYSTDTWTCDQRQDPVQMGGSGICARGTDQNTGGAVVSPCLPTGPALADYFNQNLHYKRCVGSTCSRAEYGGPGNFYIVSCYNGQYTCASGATFQNVPTFTGTLTGTQCPAVPDFEDPAYRIAGGPPDADGKCPTGRYTGTNEDDFSWRYGRANSPSVMPPVLDDVIRRSPGVISDDMAGPGDLSGPSTVPKPGGGTTTTTTSPGGTTTTTSQGVYNITYNGDTYNITETTTNTTNNSGGTTTTTTTAPPEVKVCGVPGQPPCKIDETGTPTADPVSPSTDAQTAISTWKTCLLSPSTCFPALPSLNWAFTFPSTCAPIPLEAFRPFLSQVDICPFQGPIHDLMSLVWAAAGLLGAVGMVGRDAAGGS